MPSFVAIMGATAAGKTHAAVRLAETFAGEIVSMDSRQVYRGLDIGTAKPSPEDRKRVRHHLIDILDPEHAGSAGRHVRLARNAIADVSRRQRLPFLVGGTGLYFRAFFYGLIDAEVPAEELSAIRRELDRKTTSELFDDLLKVDRARAEALARTDRIRISRALEVYLSTGKTVTEHFSEQDRGVGSQAAADSELRMVVTLPRAVLRERIERRTRDMYRAGWIDEVRRLLEEGLTLESPAMNSLGYRTIATAILERGDPNETLGRVITLTQQYAKRQETFFRGIPGARWIDMSADDALDQMARLIEGLPGRPAV